MRYNKGKSFKVRKDIGFKDFYIKMSFDIFVVWK